jgi:hypothetical protein
MNTWAAPGVKCVCINDGWGSVSIGSVSLPTRVPMLNEVLTIAEVKVWDDATLVLSFHEIPLLQEDRNGAEAISGACWWNVRHFRPLTTRKTDISIFKKMLTPAPKVREPA